MMPKRQYAPTTLRLLSCLLLLALLAACAKRLPEAPMPVDFLPCPGDLLAANGTRMDMAEFARIAANYDYILVGEGHRNPCDHAVQRDIVEAMARSGRPLSIGLEMVAVDHQFELDEFAAGRIPLDDLEDQLDWKDQWGYPFSLFRPIFALAERYSIPVGALSAPFALARKIGREGMDKLTPAERAVIPQTPIPPMKAQEEMLREVMSMHSGMDADDPAARERFFLVQSLWDTQMAAEAEKLRARFGWPVLVLAGDGHVEYGWGVAHRLSVLDPGAKVLLVSPWRGLDFDADKADVFFYCPQSFRSRLGMRITVEFGELVVTEIAPDSRAFKAGIRPGDVLTESMGVPLTDLGDLHTAGSEAFRRNKPLSFVVRRGRRTYTTDVGLLGKQAPPHGMMRMPQKAEQPAATRQPPAPAAKTPTEEAPATGEKPAAPQGDAL